MKFALRKGGVIVLGTREILATDLVTRMLDVCCSLCLAVKPLNHKG